MLSLNYTQNLTTYHYSQHTTLPQDLFSSQSNGNNLFTTPMLDMHADQSLFTYFNMSNMTLCASLVYYTEFKLSHLRRCYAIAAQVVVIWRFAFHERRNSFKIFPKMHKTQGTESTLCNNSLFKIKFPQLVYNYVNLLIHKTCFPRHRIVSSILYS